MTCQNKRPGVGWSLLVLLVLCVLVVGFLTGRVDAAIPPRPVRVKIRQARDPCLVRLDNRSVAKIAISVDGTVLDFPLKPDKVILGRKGSFGVEYVESDLAISPLGLSSRSHLYVYLQDRRFTFDLSTTAAGSCPVVAVRDALDNQVSVDGFFRPKK